jgi:phage tail tape-measure protein
MSKTEQAPVLKEHKHHTGEAAAIAGEIAGAVIGSAAGPVGMVAGMVVGALAGTLVGEGLEANEERVSRHDKELDEELGISGGDIGAVQSVPPPALSGAAAENESSPDWPMKGLGTEPKNPE